jgi:hypothetical protein
MATDDPNFDSEELIATATEGATTEFQDGGGGTTTRDTAPQAQAAEGLSQPIATFEDRRISHIADYAIACNRFVNRVREPHTRIFQIGGRRRLVHACGVAKTRLNKTLAESATDTEWVKKFAETLADLAIVIADSIFRERGVRTAVRLLLFLVSSLNIALGGDPLKTVEKELRDAIRRGDRNAVADVIATKFEFPIP